MSPFDEETLKQEVLEEVEGLSEEEIEVEAEKILAKREKQKAYRSKAPLTPEALEKRKEYRKKRYLREQAIIAKAKELGITE